MTVIPWSLASPSTHWAWISWPIVCSLSALYSVLHCLTYTAVACLGAEEDLGTALALAAAHFLKSGGSGTTTAWPGVCELDFAVIDEVAVELRLGDVVAVDRGHGVPGDAASARGEQDGKGQCGQQAAENAEITGHERGEASNATLWRN